MPSRQRKKHLTLLRRQCDHDTKYQLKAQSVLRGIFEIPECSGSAQGLPHWPGFFTIVKPPHITLWRDWGSTILARPNV